jgi:lipopolysaccharide exporter
MSNLKKGVFASLLLVSQSILDKLIGLVSTLVLARVLLPEDFGIVAIATLTVGFFEILSNTGSVQYLLRAHKINDSDVNTAWTINILLRLVLALALYGSSFFASSYYEDPRLQNLMLALALVYFVEAWHNPGIIYLKRKQEYASIFKVTVSGKVLAVCSAISIAVIYESYWALVVSQAVSKISMVIGYYIIYPFKPKFELRNAKKQWAFSGWIVPQSILGYFRTQLDTFLASSLFGKAELGSYYTMKYIAHIPTSHIILPMTESFLVEMRRVSVDVHNFKKIYNSALLIALLIAAPISSFLYYFHELTTLVLLGEQWTKYSKLLAGFSLLIISATLHQHCCKTLIIFNKPKHILIYEITTFIIIYSILFMVGFGDVMVFTYVRVGIEQLLSLCFLLYVSLKYTDVKTTLRLFFGILLIITSCILSVFGTSFLPSMSAFALIDLGFKSACFFTLFYANFGLCYFLFLRRFSEWEYISSLIVRISGPVIKKLVRN